MLCIHISRFSPGYLSKGLLKLINLLQCKYIHKCYIYIYIIYVYIKVLSKLHFQRAAKTHQLVVVHTYISTDIYISKYFIYTYTSRFSQGCVSEGPREVGGWGRDPFSRNFMKPTPRRKWYLTTGRRFH